MFLPSSYLCKGWRIALLKPILANAIIPFQKGIQPKSKSIIYISILLCMFLVGKLYSATMVISPYTIFLGIFLSYFGYGKSLSIHAGLFFFNELPIMPTMASLVESIGGPKFLPLLVPIYVGYFYFTFAQSILIKKALEKWTPLFRMIKI
jgi:hypothetical protein